MKNNVLIYLKNMVKKRPQKIAFSDGENRLTFAELGEAAGRIGSYLHRNGIYKQPVVVFMKKSPREIAAFLGIVAGGCFYVPIDEEMPTRRIQLILDNVKAPLILCDETTLEVAKGFQVGDGRIVLYDSLQQEQTDRKALEAIFERAIDTDPIYIVFTSGSLGVPKGVAACHRSVIDYIEQLSEVLDFNETTVFGNQSPLYFDACLKEIYPTLKFGATTYLIPKKYFSLPVMLVEYLNQYKINTICWVVSALTMISSFGTFSSVVPKYLRTVAFGSEVMPSRQLRLWRQVLPDAAFFNLYGPTETTGMCCYYRVEREFADDETVPIGKSFDNREVLLLDEAGQSVPKGEQGEICIRGTALTLGYYNDTERTEAAFVQNPLQSCYQEKIYRTGDMGRLNDRGELCFVSRKDFQIKHMGHRIELGEIESNVSALADIQICACIYDSEKSKLVLFFVGTLTERELILSLKKRLPRYMLPNATVRLEQMPFTANGKIDRLSLKDSCKNN